MLSIETYSLPIYKEPETNSKQKIIILEMADGAPRGGVCLCVINFKLLGQLLYILSSKISSYTKHAVLMY